MAVDVKESLVDKLKASGKSTCSSNIAFRQERSRGKFKFGRLNERETQRVSVREKEAGRDEEMSVYVTHSCLWQDLNNV